MKRCEVLFKGENERERKKGGGGGAGRRERKERRMQSFSLEQGREDQGRSLSNPPWFAGENGNIIVRLPRTDS